MTEVANAVTGGEARSLAERWVELSEREPRLRQRDAADRLGCSEGALVASQLGGEGFVRLKESWFELLKDFESLGRVMALTRNPHCVIEKVGVYQHVTVASRRRSRHGHRYNRG